MSKSKNSSSELPPLEFAVREWLKEWRAKDDSYIIPQFLSSYDIGWDALKSVMHAHPEVRNEFQVTLAMLADRWLRYGISSKLLPRHMEKAFARYLTLYDDHLWEKETDQKKAVARTEVDTVMGYVAEDYAKSTLEGLYHELYAQNERKRKFEK